MMRDVALRHRAFAHQRTSSASKSDLDHLAMRKKFLRLLTKCDAFHIIDIVEMPVAQVNLARRRV